MFTSLPVSFLDSLAARRRVLLKDMKMRFINLAGSRELQQQEQQLPGKLEQEQNQAQEQQLKQGLASAAATQH